MRQQLANGLQPKQQQGPAMRQMHQTVSCTASSAAAGGLTLQSRHVSAPTPPAANAATLYSEVSAQQPIDYFSNDSQAFRLV